MRMDDLLFAIGSYIDAGGNVLWVILIVAVVLWTLILERYWYHWRVFPREFSDVRQQWEATSLTDIWQARKIQQMDVARLRHQLGGSVFLIRTCIALCPLLGLLGTVVGMIQVFEVLEFSGTGNPRAIASGVSMATIPTMSGLVVALSGLFFSIDLARASENKARKAADVLSQTLAKVPGLHCHVPHR